VLPTTAPVSIDRTTSETGSGVALDVGAAVAVRRWTLGFGASGVANRMEWEELRQQ
jgi:hypothetical protein